MPELSYSAGELHSVGTPLLWTVTIVGVLALLVLDFAVTHRPHRVSLKEALGWSAFYIALPLIFGAWVWSEFGSEQGVHFLTGYLVEKSLSVDNLFVFMLLLAAFAVPTELAQRVLLFGIAGALVLRSVFIALGAAALQTLDFAFLIFALILLFTAAKLLRDAFTGHEQTVDIGTMRSVRLLRKFMPVVHEYHGTKMIVRVNGRRALTPLALVVVAVFATDAVFAVDSVPAVYGITEDPYLVFATNAFALLGLRALYFVLHAALSRLVHLSYGLAVILAFIGVKLGLHWAHGVWEGVPLIPTAASLLVIIGVLTVVTITSLRATRNVVPGSKEVVTERR
ncbi:TerC/Alx family metal homeostasis membrane protein [Micromonospora sp. NPDC002389]|uniref:TerC/Alx family metal homeostasis membrane protein n=1 Tax=Micromonospora sp. NPDC002389 TaxID=3154272 RepID=UPI00331F80F7